MIFLKSVKEEKSAVRMLNNLKKVWAMKKFSPGKFQRHEKNRACGAD